MMQYQISNLPFRRSRPNQAASYYHYQVIRISLISTSEISGNITVLSYEQ